MSQSLRELGLDLLEDAQHERALGVFAEAVRRMPADHRSRMLAAKCLAELGEKERAVLTLGACAEGLLRRDYLLSAIAACKMAMDLKPSEKRVRETLERIHERAVRSSVAKAKVPPPLPPEALYEGKVEHDLMGLHGSELSDKAIEVLASADTGEVASSEDRPPLPLFANLERGAFIELVSAMAYRSLKPDEVICREGEGGEALYVIVAGKGEVTRRTGSEEKTLGFLGGGAIFGELSLLTGAPPTATVAAVNEAEIFEVRRDDLNRVAKLYPQTMTALVDFAQARMAKNLFATSALFQQIPETDRAPIFNRFTFRALQPGEKALVEGQHSPGLFLVLAGELVVQKEDPAGGAVTLSVLREGDVAGEISLLTGLRATATVQASRKTATATLERRAFEELLGSFPKLREYLENLSNRRLKEIGEALRPAEIIDADELVVETEGS